MSHSDVSFLNVGAGACTLIESPSGRVSMVDINDGGSLREALAMSQIDRLLRSAELDQLQAKLVDPVTWVKTYVKTSDVFHSLEAACRQARRAAPGRRNRTKRVWFSRSSSIERLMILAP